QYLGKSKCDETLVNLHMFECYKKVIDPTIDITTEENQYFMDGSNLCQAYNRSLSYRKCLYSIFARNKVCSFDQHQYSYESFKIYWKLIINSCAVENDNDDCLPSNLNKEIINKCHYSSNYNFPIQCREFLRSVKCIERHEKELIPSTYESKCSRNKAYYNLYENLSTHFQSAINICEMNLTS
ncbi:unnamed protein product, partial [Adineta steineri]